MQFDAEYYEKKRQAARAAYLKRSVAQRQAAAQGAVQQRIEELEQGVLTSEAEAERLLERYQEVEVAKGLVSAAKSRIGMEGVAVMDEGHPGRVLPDDVDIASSEPLKTVNRFVELNEEEIQKRIAEQDYMVEKSAQELEQDTVQQLQQRREHLREQRRSLPIYRVRNEMMELIRNHQVIVVVGETGSGKTTQLLQYLYEEGMHLKTSVASSAVDGESRPPVEELRLICTQPRRIAAVSVAERVSHELGCRCGGVVGYKVRFDDKSSAHTKILFVTDGIMLKEFTNDPSLETVAAIMIDEAHERSINSDILLGLLRDLIRRNSQIRVIVASATINADKFSKFFDGAPIFNVTGRTHPVETFYSEEPIADYVTEAAQTAMGIHLMRPLPGDILIFLPGQDSIEICVETLKEYAEEEKGTMRPLLILPIFSSLPPKEQNRIYENTPENTRKVVVATNIAETSITIDGVVYVIDCGLCKQNYYNPKAMTEELRVVPISQASAMQRAGRAGRTQPGECFRLYTSYVFRNELPPDTIPEVWRCSMSAVVLQLKVLGIDNLEQFDFLDKPSTASLEVALDQLFLLGAMKADGRLTVTGRRMAEFPLEPSWSKALVRSSKLGCARHMAMAAAMLTLESVFHNSRDAVEKRKVESAKEVFFSHVQGDVAGFVNLMDNWLRSKSPMDFCRKYSVQYRSLSKAREVLYQILSTLERVGLELDADPATNEEMTGADYMLLGQTASAHINVELLTKALLSGFFYNVARLEPDKRTYRLVRPLESSVANYVVPDGEEDDGAVEIHPASYLFKSGMNSSKQHDNDRGGKTLLRERPPLVVFTSLRHTTKRFMVHLTAIPSADWVLECSPQNYFEREMLEDMNSRKRARPTDQEAVWN